MFKTFSAPDEAAAAIQDFLRSEEGRALPQEVQDQAWEFLRPGSSISFAVAYFAELAFARAAELEGHDKALQIAASAAQYGSANFVDNLGGERGGKIMQALRRDSGEPAPAGMQWPAKSKDPKKREQFEKRVKLAPAPPAPPINPEEDAANQVALGPDSPRPGRVE